MPRHTCSCDDLCGLLGDPVLLECPFFSACSQGLFTTTPLPLAVAPNPGFREELAGGKGKVGGDGLEEIEHSVSGLNGCVSPGAGGCQMMDGMDTILTHQSTGLQSPPAAYRAPSCTQAWAPRYPRGRGRQQGPSALPQPDPGPDSKSSCPEI